jgi:DNA-binding LacI/PurR family transcriptional regulator
MLDIAKCVGVSIVSVSKALSNKEGVSEEMRVRIKEVAKEMGYDSPHPSRISKAKFVNGTGNIGVLIPKRFLERGNSFYWSLYEMVAADLLPNNYYAILEVLQTEDEEIPALPHMLMDEKIDGLIVLGQLEAQYQSFLKENVKLPLMTLDSYDASGKDCVISDGYYGMYAITDYLIRMGHTDICFVGSVGATSSITDRFFGFSRALSERGIKVTDEMVIEDRNAYGTIKVDLPERLPTAFVCNCDMTAYEMMDVLLAKGIRVPEDVSIVGFDNYAPNIKMKPEITTYSVDMAGMSRACIERILRKINVNGYVSSMKVISGSVLIKNSVLPREIINQD